MIYFEGNKSRLTVVSRLPSKAKVHATKQMASLLHVGILQV